MAAPPPPPPIDYDTPVVGRGRSPPPPRGTSPPRSTSPLQQTKLRPPPAVAAKTAPRGPSPPPAAERPEWAPTGFDFINTTIQRALLRIDGVESLDVKWRMLSDLLQQYSVDADASLYSVALSSFLESVKEKTTEERAPNHTLTCAGCVVIDQLLLLLKRTFPHLAQLVMAARGVVLQSIFIIPNQEADIMPFDNVTDQYEVQEQLERFNKKAYFQSTRELSARVTNNPSEYEQDEVIRENQSACVNRIVDHWQGEFKLLLLKAWRCHHRHQKQSVAQQGREQLLREEIESLRAEVAARDSKIVTLERQIAELQDSSEMLKKLESAMQGKLLLQKECEALTRGLSDSKQMVSRLEAAMRRCVHTLRDVGVELQKDTSQGHVLEVLDSSLADVEKPNTISETQLVDMFNAVLESSDRYVAEYKVTSLTEGHALLDPYLLMTHLVDPAAVPPDDLAEALALKDYVAKADRVMHLCNCVGVGFGIPGQSLVAPAMTWLHLSMVVALLARLCDPATRADPDALRGLEVCAGSEHLSRGSRSKRGSEVVFDFTHDPELVVSYADSEAQKLKKLVKKGYQGRQAAFAGYRLALHTALEKLLGMSSKVYTISETLSIEAFCNPAAIVQEDDPQLRELLVNNYRLLRLLFLDSADAAQMYPISSLWSLLEDSGVTAPHVGFTQAHFDAITTDLSNTFGVEDTLTDTQWVYALLKIAEEVGRTKQAGKPPPPRHECMYTLLSRYLFTSGRVVDVTEFKEAIHRLDVQDVLQEYTVHLHRVFEHYSDDRKSRININRFIGFVEDCGFVNGKDPAQRKEIVTVCCAMYQTLRDSIGRINTDRAVNFYLFTEIVCCLAAYDSGDAPYLPLALSVRRFCESRLLRHLPAKVASLRSIAKQDPLIWKSTRAWSRRSVFGLQDFIAAPMETPGAMATAAAHGKRKKSITTLNNDYVFAEASLSPDPWTRSPSRGPRASISAAHRASGAASPNFSPRPSFAGVDARRPSFV
eukprot:TRINITY_DN25437_c0_g1_i1.p1 TRINITY_DN25437_c0_g1~~TRINITY_DN25437_c0_g1_i1.p1  ORF type:complete len:1121 (+),score=354.46 TRINITY_DN25437_c0_g1_i1:379-3363(+)